MKKVLAALGVATICSLGVVSSANAAATATSNITIDPQTSLFKEALRPVNFGVQVKVTAAPGDLSLTPLINSTLNLPTDVHFVPAKGFPVCDAITVNDANFTPEAAKAKCGTSIIGDGNSDLALAGSTSPASFRSDPVLTIFNGGVDANGGGILKIHAYSKSTFTGILLTGSISKAGVLSVDIPSLTADSAVPRFQLNIPGTIGLDKSYVQATCSTGSYKTNAVIKLANRSATGEQSNQQTLTTPEQTQACTGATGSPKLSTKVKGPSKVKSGKKGAFKVTVTNKGTGSSKKGKITASGGGKGSGSVSAVTPGSSKTFTVKAKVTGKKGKKVTVKFKYPGGSGSAKVKVG